MMCDASAVCVIFKPLPGEQLGDSFNERDRESERVGEKEKTRIGTTGDGCHVLQHFGFQSHNSLTRSKAQQSKLPPAFKAKLLGVKHYYPLLFFSNRAACIKGMVLPKKEYFGIIYLDYVILNL